ncbi:MAG: undecaprenyl/decaprenyl-phosphate alpha-N-acetylglucosaminyl 1-phosphate transferase [Phycisphaerales bacterium]|nr:undecaprenyl/decaprenyl-phosphate alpha-N-acetylglucosaminyl 1-phosphate transferase [Phycisphaerales bacterium]
MIFGSMIFASMIIERALVGLPIWVLSAVLSWILIHCVCILARRRGLVAAVRADRWHALPTPIFGGVGIVVAFLLAFAVTRGALDEFRDATSADGSLVIALIVGAVSAAAVGLWDDLAHFRPSTKLAAQCACASLFLWIAGGVEITASAPVDGVIALIWIVTVMNAVNMLDNMDGVAGTAVMIGLIGVAAVSVATGSWPYIALIAVICAGCVAGFLGHNLPRARVFMGDAGSLFLGFMLAALVLLCAKSVALPVGLLIALGCVFVPLLDMSVVSLSRIRRGQSPMQGGRDHTTHRLVTLGVSERGAVWIVAGVAVVGAAGAVAATLVASLVAVVVAMSALFVLLVAALLRICIRMDGAAHMRAAAFTPFVKVVIDVVTIAAVLNAGYLVRWDFAIPPELANSVAWSLPVALACCVATNALRGMYESSWRWNGASARAALVNALIGAVLAVVVIAAAWSPERLFSRAAMGIFLVGYPLVVVVVRGAVGWVVR